MGAEYFGYDEVEFDLDLQAYAAYWAAPEIRMQLDSKTIEKFKTIKGISEGADMQVYCGHASSCQDVNFIGKLVDHRINGPKPADRDERGESFNQVS